MIINGVPSFCAAAAEAGLSLAENNETIHILPGNCDDGLVSSLSGTRVLMKSGKKLAAVLDQVDEQDSVCIVENCGLPEQRIYYDRRQIDERTGYFTLAIIKRKEEQL